MAHSVFSTVIVGIALTEVLKAALKQAHDVMMSNQCGSNVISLERHFEVVCRVATVREKYLENEIFSRSGKCQGIL